MFIEVLNEAKKTDSYSQLVAKFPHNEKIIKHLIKYNMIIVENAKITVHPMIGDLISRVNGFSELFDFWRFYGYGRYIN